MMTMIDIQLYNGDCLDVMDELIEQGIKVDMVLADPPYGSTCCHWDSVILFEPMWQRINKLIKPNGAILLFSKQPFTSDLVNSNRNAYRYELIWEKTRAGNNMQLKNQFAQIHENIEVFYYKQPTYNDIQFKVDEKYIDKRKSIRNSFYNSEHYKGIMKRKKDDGYRHPQSILPFNSVWGKNMHPTQKPVALLEYLIKTYTHEGDMVLDFTMGSGSTMVACLNTNRKGIGIELDKHYFEIAQDRLANNQQQLKMDI